MLKLWQNIIVHFMNKGDFMDNLFFKPTKTYREYVILNQIERSSDITQRQLSLVLNASLSLVHQDLDYFIQKGYISKRHIHTTKAQYFLTDYGFERKRYLDLSYYYASQKLYIQAKKNLKQFLKTLTHKGFEHILLYGAGEASSMLIACIKELGQSLTIVALIDDDKQKQSFEHEYHILSLQDALEHAHDGVLIASFAYHQQMVDRLLHMGYDENKIIRYFS